MPIKFLVVGGGGGGFLEWGGGFLCRIYFYGRGDFPDLSRSVTILKRVVLANSRQLPTPLEVAWVLLARVLWQHPRI